MNGKKEKHNIYNDGKGHTLRSAHMGESFCQKIMENIYEPGKAMDVMGMTLTDIEPGWARGEIVLEKKHVNTIGTIHGGVVFLLADSVAGYAAATRAEMVTTLSSSIYFMRPVINVKKLLAEATELKAGKNILVFDVAVMAGDGRVLCKATFEYSSLHKKLLNA